MKIDEAILEKQKEEKVYTNENVEGITSGVDLEGYNKETRLTIEGVQLTEKKQEMQETLGTPRY